jgi:ligand-binding sensor domain-containing protein
MGAHGLARGAGKTVGPLCKVEGKNLKCFAASESVLFGYADALTEDNQGYLWVASDTALIRWKAGSSQKYAPGGLRAAKDLYGVSSLFADADGSVFRGGQGLGLEHIVGSPWSSLKVFGLDTSTLAGSGIYKDHKGSLWIGTVNQELHRIHSGRWEHNASSDGLSSNNVLGIGEDAEGDLWATTDVELP